MFYGWKIVGVTFATHFISMGFIFYSFGVFFKALEGEFGGGRLGISLGLTIMSIMTALFAPFLGRALDRGSIRNIMCVGAVALSIGFLLASRITALWQFYIVLAFLGLSAAMMGGLPSSTLVSNWFVERRGTALGIASMGISVSGVIMAPMTTRLIDTLGWRNTFIIFGLTSVTVTFPLIRAFVVNRPEDRGLYPDGAPDPPSHEASDPVVPLAPGGLMIDHAAGLQWKARGVLRDRNFWIIAVTMGLNFCAMSAVLTHFIPHATDLGFSPAMAANVLAVAAGAGVAGKILFGFIADRIDTRFGFWLAMLFQATGLLGIQSVTHYPPLLLAGACFGLGMGGLVPLMGSLIGGLFGRRAFGRVMGLLSPCMVPIQTFGVPFAGLVYDRTGSYDIAFKTFLGAYAVAAAVLLFLRPPAAEQVNHGGKNPDSPAPTADSAAPEVAQNGTSEKFDIPSQK